MPSSWVDQQTRQKYGTTVPQLWHENNLLRQSLHIRNEQLKDERRSSERWKKNYADLYDRYLRLKQDLWRARRH